MKRITFFLLAFVLSVQFSFSQDMAEKKSFKIKKGQALDILMLNVKPGAEAAQQEYLKEVFPIASKLGYKPLPGLPVISSPTQGNYYPDVVVVATWESVASRGAAMKSIEDKVPGFHQKRRDIWSTFNITYFEIRKDISFDLDAEKFYVITAYWENEEKSFQKFTKNWEQSAKKAGGKIKLNLMNGISPFGYYHQPDYLAITEWENQAAFEAFHTKNLTMDHSGVKHVNEFPVK